MGSNPNREARPEARHGANRNAAAAFPDDDRAFPQRRSIAAGAICGLLPLAGLAIVWSLAALWWPTLPARIPLHFDGAGVPDRWGPASVANWFMLPFVATWLTVLAGGIAAFMPALVRTWPAIVNVPQKKRWMALPPEARVRTAAPVRWLLAGVGLLMNGLFAWILWGTRWVAMDPDPTKPTRTLGGLGPLFVFVGAMLVGVLFATLRMRALVIRESEAADSPRDVTGA